MTSPPADPPAGHRHPSAEHDAPGQADRTLPEVDRKTADRKTVDRKTLDEIFGDVFPDTTSDERGPGATRSGLGEDWYRENRPPHHGD